MVTLLLTIRLAQLILKCKFPSVEKPPKKGHWKYKSQGLFSEFYGNTVKQVASPRCLGVELDNELKYDTHVIELIKSYTEKLRIIIRFWETAHRPSP